MTLDKFGRHIVKHTTPVGNMDSDTISLSQYMYYEVILKFESDFVVEDKFILFTGNINYFFPLEFGLIENIRFFDNKNDDEIMIFINDKMFTKNELQHFPLHQNDYLSFSNFSVKNNSTEKLRVEIIIKCPIKFENSLVKAEQAYYLHSSQDHHEK